MAKTAKWLNTILDYMVKVRLSISMNGSYTPIPNRQYDDFILCAVRVEFYSCRYSKANVVTGDMAYIVSESPPKG